MNFARSVMVVLLAAVLAPCTDMLAAQRVDFPPPLEVRVPKPPTVAHGGGQSILPYELQITNLGTQPITIQRIDVVNATSGALLQSLSDSVLARAIARPALRATTLAERPRIGAGLRAIVYLWVPLADRTAPPAAVRERLTTVGPGADSTTPKVLETVPVPVSTDVLVITPPLRGGVWLAANGPSAESGHRRAAIPVYGGFYIAQRFAIDWVKVDEQNKTYKGDSLQNSSYYAYGNDALAVADGIVTEVKDGIPQNVPGLTSRAVPITLETVGGNHVIVNLGHGRYAFYAHLQPGKIRVRVGDHVKRGQVLGLVGNSGNSTEPHLHFHISDASSPLGSEGIPYELQSFVLVGSCRSLMGGCTRSSPVVKHREMPFANELVRFP
jgi:peptidase M23-like protein